MSTVEMRGPECKWPWPYVQLSNGIQMENGEVLLVRCLRDFDGSTGSKAKAGARVGLRHECNGRLSLVNFGSGNRRYLEITPDPIENQDYETISEEKLRLANQQARDIIAEAIGEDAAMAREDREIGPQTRK